MSRFRLLLALCSASSIAWMAAPVASAQQVERHPVLMISVDAMNPHYIFQAQERGTRIPFLLGFLKEGSYATSVLNVVPTITNPNHVTLITGVHPEKHGVFNNMVQEPNANARGVPMEYGNAIRSRTLWEAAHDAGLKTGSVMWPVSLGARGIDYNIPPVHTDHAPEDHFMVEALSRPEGYLAELEKTAGLFSADKDEDEFAMPVALATIRNEKPYFMTVHLSGLDEAQHQSGPDSPEAFAALEKLDSQVKQLVMAERTVYPEADIAIVSDHGFFPVSKVINLNSEFARQGLLTLSHGEQPQIVAWKAFSWTGGGSAVVMLHDPSDKATAEKVFVLLKKLQQDPTNGIDRVLTKDEAAPMGGTPQTAFLIDCRPGFYVGRGLTTPLITEAHQKGTHGFLATHPELQSAFMIEGRGIAKGRNLGMIDMRQIAPTIAKELGVTLPEVRLSVLKIR